MEELNLKPAVDTGHQENHDGGVLTVFQQLPDYQAGADPDEGKEDGSVEKPGAEIAAVHRIIPVGGLSGNAGGVGLEGHPAIVESVIEKAVQLLRQGGEKRVIPGIAVQPGKQEVGRCKNQGDHRQQAADWEEIQKEFQVPATEGGHHQEKDAEGSGPAGHSEHDETSHPEHCQPVRPVGLGLAVEKPGRAEPEEHPSQGVVEGEPKPATDGNVVVLLEHRIAPHSKKREEDGGAGAQGAGNGVGETNLFHTQILGGQHKEDGKDQPGVVVVEEYPPEDKVDYIGDQQLGKVIPGEKENLENEGPEDNLVQLDVGPVGELGKDQAELSVEESDLRQQRNQGQGKEKYAGFPAEGFPPVNPEHLLGSGERK